MPKECIVCGERDCPRHKNGQVPEVLIQLNLKDIEKAVRKANHHPSGLPFVDKLTEKRVISAMADTIDHAVADALLAIADQLIVLARAGKL